MYEGYYPSPKEKRTGIINIISMEIVSMEGNNLPTAPDFTLESFKGQTVTLSQFESQKYVLLVFNRGFL